MANVKLNRYEFGYSQVERGLMVVFAPTYEEAVARFENEEYEIQPYDEE
jgi:hypothetical protein